jgi:hypothetical protein
MIIIMDFDISFQQKREKIIIIIEKTKESSSVMDYYLMTP